MVSENCCGLDASSTVADNEGGFITFELEGGDRHISVTCDEYVDIYTLAARFREFLLALGYGSGTVDEVIDESVYTRSYEALDIPEPYCPVDIGEEMERIARMEEAQRATDKPSPEEYQAGDGASYCGSMNYDPTSSFNSAVRPKCDMCGRRTVND